MMYLCSHPSKSSATLPKFKSETCATPRRYISEPFKTRYSAPHPYSLHTPSSLFQSPSPIHRILPIPTSMRRRTNPPFGSARSRGPQSRFKRKDPRSRPLGAETHVEISTPRFPTSRFLCFLTRKIAQLKPNGSNIRFCFLRGGGVCLVNIRNRRNEIGAVGLDCWIMTFESRESGAEASHEDGCTNGCGAYKTTLRKERRPVGTDVPTRGAMCNKALYFPKQKRIVWIVLEVFMRNSWLRDGL